MKKKHKWILKLYIAGKTSNSTKAIENLKKICEEMVPNEYTIEIIDLSVNPQLALADQIVALPTVVRKLPSPMRKLIGDLSDKEKVLVALNMVKEDEIHD